MSIEQYQRAVNSLDKEIADLEKKKSAQDKKRPMSRKKRQIFPSAGMRPLRPLKVN